MKRYTSIACGLALVIAVLLAPSPARAQDRLERIITRSGDQLMDGDSPFRFITFNIPNLQLI